MCFHKSTLNKVFYKMCNPFWSWTYGDLIIWIQHNQYHGCWCSGSLHHQDISNNDIGYVEVLVLLENYQCHISVEEWCKLYLHLCVSYEKFSITYIAPSGLRNLETWQSTLFDLIMPVGCYTICCMKANYRFYFAMDLNMFVSFK